MALAARLQDFDFDNNIDLSLAIDLQEIQQTDQYNDLTDEVSISKVEFNDEVDDKVTATSPATLLSVIMKPSFHQSFSAFLEDTSESISHHCIKDEPSRFKLALGLWCEDIGIFRTQYTGLLEILWMLQSTGVSELAKLPDSLSTLKRHIKGQLPLL